MPRVGLRKLSDIFSRLYVDWSCTRRLEELPPLKIVFGIPRSGTTMLAKRLSGYGFSLSEPFRQTFFFGNVFQEINQVPAEYLDLAKAAPVEAIKSLANTDKNIFIKSTFIGAGQWSWRNDHILSKLAETGKHRMCGIVRDPRAIYHSAETRKEAGDSRGMITLTENVRAFEKWMDKVNLPWIRYEDFVGGDSNAQCLLMETLAVSDTDKALTEKIVGGGDVAALASDDTFTSSSGRFRKEMQPSLQEKIYHETARYCEVFGYDK